MRAEMALQLASERLVEREERDFQRRRENPPSPATERRLLLTAKRFHTCQTNLILPLNPGRTVMEQYVALDVSLQKVAVCSATYVERPARQALSSDISSNRNGAVICPAFQRGHRPLALMKFAMRGADQSDAL
jgi:hypothetical protein